ncbi:hypothetical protein [Methylocystis sp. MJC1]|uniref:hypothetical protein n=2 Tax=Methylocystis sp. MJC1 TaxID=2654282 RepID=UPI001C1DDA1B|nr:hypothetical protein [Methylocystis sp. MJC1]
MKGIARGVTMQKIDIFLRRVITNNALAFVSISIVAILCNVIAFWIPLYIGVLDRQLGAFWILMFIPLILLGTPTVYAVYIFTSFEFRKNNSTALNALAAVIFAFLGSAFLLWLSLALAFRNL